MMTIYSSRNLALCFLHSASVIIPFLYNWSSFINLS